MILWLVILGHLVCGVSYIDFICTGLEANQIPKNSAFGYDMKHMKMNEWSRDDSSPYSDLKGHISLVLGQGDFSCQNRTCGTSMNRFENRHCTKFSIYLGYMMKGLNYTKIQYTERLIKPLIFLTFGWSWWLARVCSWSMNINIFLIELIYIYCQYVKDLIGHAQ